jgi:hypothetical protein
MKRLLKLSAFSAATIAVLLLFASPALAQQTMPFETLVYSPWQEKAVIGQPHSFGFWVFHPNPNAVVTAGRVVFTNAVTRKPVTSVTITGISHYVIETDWTYDNTPPPNWFKWSKVTLGAGTYRWHVVVTVNGVSNTMFDEGTLKVTKK